MTPEELSNALSRMYREAPHSGMATAVHLFGIRYADEIRESGASAAAIVRDSEVPDSYVTEVHKGIALARHVVEVHQGVAPPSRAVAPPAQAGMPLGTENWVLRRARRTPQVVFDSLRDQVERDIQAFNELPLPLMRANASFAWETSGERRFSVLREWLGRDVWAVFELSDANEITVHGAGCPQVSVAIDWSERDTYTLHLAVTHEGHMSHSSEATCEDLSRIVLEPLMFEWP